MVGHLWIVLDGLYFELNLFFSIFIIFFSIWKFDGFSCDKLIYEYFPLFSAVDHFKKQFAYLEEHYVNGATVAPPERQHASLPRYLS